jgi:hypothetical protein
VNANQVFGWRRLYLAGRLGDRKPGMKLLPVGVSESVPAPLPMERVLLECLQAGSRCRGTRASGSQQE